MSKKTDFLESPSQTIALPVEGKAINKEGFERNRKNSTQNKASSSYDTSSIVSDGSISAAEQLILDIDDINAAFKNARAKSSKKTAKTESVIQHPVYSDTDENGVSSSEKSSFLSLVSSSLKPNIKSSKLEAFDATGELNLDVLEKWVSTSNTEISWPSARKDRTTTSTSESGGKTIKTRLRQSDIAVEEIDAMIATISDATAHCKSPCRSEEALRQSDIAVEEIDAIIATISDATAHCKSPCRSEEALRQSDTAVKEIDAIIATISDAKAHSKSPCRSKEVEATVERNLPTPPSTSSAFDFSMPATNLVQPLAAVRLPPLKGAALDNDDIFNRKITDMSLLHIPRYLPKLEKVNSKHLKEPQSCEERIGVSEKPEVSHFTTRVAKYIPEVLLPGQASGSISDGKQESVRVRRVILDYSTSNDQSKKKKSTKSRFLKLFACCRTQTDDSESDEDRSSVGRVKDSLEEIRFDIDMSSEQSTQSSIWQRIKKCLRF